MKTFSNIAMMVGMLTLSACATPDPALQQANHTTALMASLEHELQNFRRVTSAAEMAQQDSIREKHQALIDEKGLSGPRIRSRLSAGDSSTQQLTERMLADADALAEDEVAASSALAANEAMLAKIMTPLSSTSAAMTNAQAKMAVMGVEMTKQARYKELFSFVQAIKANIAENRKKIEAAEIAAAK